MTDKKFITIRWKYGNIKRDKADRQGFANERIYQ